jgi:uridine kinase
MSADSLSADTLIEPLCGPYSRVSLTWLKHGLSVTTLAKLFYLSANAESANSESANTDSVQENSALRELFIQRLALVEDLIKEGLLPFTEADFHSSFAHWEQSGFDAFHHSQPYRDHYHPAYRVISHRYIPFLPLLAKLDSQLQKGPVTLAVEGGSASGKSTLGALLCELYGCTLFHMDDYFLRPFQRTKERLAQPGGNVDRERFLEEILLPLSAHRAVTYQPYDCSTGSLCPPVTVIPQRLTVIEGAYSMHPELACYYDLSAFLDVDPALQTARIQKRNSPAMAQRFFNEWIPLEQTYFEAFHIKDRCTLVIPIQPCYNRPNCV